MDAVCPRCKTVFPKSRGIRFMCTLCNREVCPKCSPAQGFAHVEDLQLPRETHLCCNDCHHRELNLKAKRDTKPVSVYDCARALINLMADSNVLDANEFIKQVEERKIKARPAKKPRRQ